MSTEEIDTIIDEGIQPRLRELAMNALLEKAGDVTLERLSLLRNSEKFGDLMKEVTLQELIESARGGKKKPGRKKKATSGGSASSTSASSSSSEEDEPEKINFRDPDEKLRYKNAIAKMIEDRGGEPVSTTELRSACGGNATQARDILQQLADEGKVIWTGRARATRYYWKDAASAEVVAEYQELAGEE